MQQVPSPPPISFKFMHSQSYSHALQPSFNFASTDFQMIVKKVPCKTVLSQATNPSTPTMKVVIMSSLCNLAQLGINATQTLQWNCSEQDRPQEVALSLSYKLTETAAARKPWSTFTNSRVLIMVRLCSKPETKQFWTKSNRNWT